MSDLQSQEIQSALRKLQDVIPGEELNELQPSGPNAVYTTLATVWLMILQRLGGGLSMQAVVKDAIQHASDIFPDHKRVREASLSTRDTAFSDARGRLKLETVTHLLEAVGDSLVQACSSPDACSSSGERPVDGTTLTTAPTSDLKQAFPPAVNQHGESVWPTVLMLVAHELHSGGAPSLEMAVPEIGAMYGEDNTSEAAMLRTLCQRLPGDSIVLADAGFGKFGPAWDCIQAGRSIAFRMSASQFKSLIKQATSLPTGCSKKGQASRIRSLGSQQRRTSRRTLTSRRTRHRKSCFIRLRFRKWYLIATRTVAIRGDHARPFSRADDRIVPETLRRGARHSRRESDTEHRADPSSQSSDV